MKILADENIHVMMVRWLRSEGHDVLWASETGRGLSDDVLLATAFKERRLILTSDTDFGELVFNQRLRSIGVVLMKMEDVPVNERIRRMAGIWRQLESRALGCLTVVTAHKSRTRKLPPSQS